MMDKSGAKGGKNKDFASKALENDKVRDMKYHIVPLDELEELLDTKIKDQYGLTESQAAERLEKNGPNALSEKKGTPWYIRLLKEMTGPFSLLLWAGAILCLIGFFMDMSDQSNLYLGIVLMIVVIVTGLFSYF